MIELAILIKGILAGLSASAPIGPVNMLCIKRTLGQGKTFGFATGVGAALADGVYAFVAAFGISFIQNFLIAQATLFKVFGGLLLLIMGIKTFFTTPEKTRKKKEPKEYFTKMYGVAGDFLSTFFLTLTNPITLIYFAALFTGFKIEEAEGEHLPAMMFVSGVALGSMIWWTMLTFGISLLKYKFTYRWLVYVNRISGVLISSFGLYFLVSVSFKLLKKFI